MLASSLKIGRKDLPPTFFFFLAFFLTEPITSRDEVGEVGHLAGEWAGEGVITRSSLETLLVFRPLKIQLD